jgi:hypothetical protein
MRRGRHHRGHAGQGVRRDGRATSPRPRDDSSTAIRSFAAGLHLHHLPPAGPGRRRGWPRIRHLKTSTMWSARPTARAGRPA